ncbi:MAG: CRISPR-associated endonuclease Cas2 [Synergistaceae bacterium]|nr:CRISPR-associated endonuclease Cas2 [Synergistaceae bacterium]
MSRIVNELTLICYDITSNKLRRKIDESLKDFGFRLQFSIFICRLDAAEVSRCKSKLQKVLNHYNKEQAPSDSLIIFERLNPGTAFTMIGESIDQVTPMFEIY